jgi:hypothetical protein
MPYTDNFNYMHKRKLFVSKFVEYCLDSNKRFEDVAVKREEAEAEGFFGTAASGVEHIGSAVAVGGDVACAATGIPVPIGSIVKETVFGAAVNIISYTGRRQANKKIKNAYKALTSVPMEELAALLHDVGLDVSIAFEYQLSQLLSDLDVMRIAAGAVSKMINYFKNSKTKELSLSKELLLEAVLKGTDSEKGKLETLLDEELAKRASIISFDKKTVGHVNSYHWNQDSVFSKVGIVDNKGNYWRKDGARVEKYGYRRPFTVELDKEYNISILGERQDFNYTVTYVTAADIISYAEICQKMKEGGEIVKSYNEYLSEKDNRLVLVKCIEDFPEDSDLSGINLSGVDLRGCSLKGVNLKGAKLKKSLLGGVDLTGAVLRDANLKGAYLANATLDGAKLEKTNLHDANLVCASLIGATVSGSTDMTGIKTAGLVYDGTALEEALLDENISDTIISLNSGFSDLQTRVEQLEQKEESEKKLVDMMTKEVGHYFAGTSSAQLHNAFTEQYGVVISGIAGAGKTQLARHYLSNKQSEGFCVYEMNASSIALLESSYRRLAEELKLCEEVDSKRIEEIIKLVNQRLGGSEKYVVLFDNADSREVREALPKYMLHSLKKGEHQVLITSQSGNFVVGGFAKVHLNGWSKEEAILFLASNSPRFNLKDAEELAKQFDNLPLGIDAARMYIDKKRIGVEEYIKRLRERSENVTTDEDRYLVGYYDKKEGYRTQVAAISMSLELLYSEHPEVRNVMNSVSSMLNERPNWRWLREKVGLNDIDLERVLEHAQDYSLIDIQGLGEERHVMCRSQDLILQTR